MSDRAFRWLIIAFVLAGLVVVVRPAHCQSFEVEIDSWKVTVSKSATAGTTITVHQAPADADLVWPVRTDANGQVTPVPLQDPPQVAAASEQVTGTCSWVSNDLEARVFGKGVTKIGTMYVCLISNESSEPVLVTENAVLKRVPQLLPYDRQTFTLALQNVVKYSALERVLRLLGDGAQLSALLTVGKIISVPVGVIEGLTAYNAELPYISKRLEGLEIPLQSNLQVLSPSSQEPIAPGDVATLHIWGAPQKANPGLATFTIQVSAAPMIRMLH